MEHLVKEVFELSRQNCKRNVIAPEDVRFAGKMLQADGSARSAHALWRASRFKEKEVTSFHLNGAKIEPHGFIKFSTSTGDQFMGWINELFWGCNGKRYMITEITDEDVDNHWEFLDIDS